MATATARTKNKKQDVEVNMTLCATCPQGEQATCNGQCPEPETAETDATPEAVPAVGQAAAMPPIPVKPAAPESDDHAILEEIRQANRECDVAFLAMDLAKAQLKEAKGEYEGAVANLRSLISAQNEQLPLFDKANRNTAGEPFPVASEEWRATPIDTLGLAPSIVKALEEAGVKTMGALADWTKDGVQKLTDIEGIGPGKAAQIEEATLEFWKEHAEAEVTDAEKARLHAETMARIRAEQEAEEGESEEDEELDEEEEDEDE